LNNYIIAAVIGFIVIVLGVVLIIAIKTRTIEGLLESDTTASSKGVGIGSGIGIGIAIGVALGLALDNLGVGIAIGIAIGAGMGATIERKNKSNRQTSIQDPRWLWGVIAAVVLLLVVGVISFMLIK